jgi:hypothetical protein
MIIEILRDFDQAIDIILDEIHQRVFSVIKGIDQIPCGLCLIRGDNVVLIDVELDNRIDFSRIRTSQLQAVKTSFLVLVALSL